MRVYNSTLTVKEKVCIICGKPCFWFSKKRCKHCATVQDIISKEEAAEEGIVTESLANMIQDLDAVFSRYVRLKYLDEKTKLVPCYTCQKQLPIGEIQNGHYIHRGDMATRFLENNCRPQCPDCNRKHNDDPTPFRDKLENERKGITEELLELSREVYKHTRDDLRIMINDYRWKVRLLEKKLKA